MPDSRYNVDLGATVSCTHDISGLTLLLWDAALTFEREWKFIWSSAQPCPRLLKCAFIIARYGPIVSQMMNSVFVWTYMSHAPLPIPIEICRNYYAYQLTTFRILMFLLDLILSLRVYHIYGGDRRIGQSLVKVNAGSIIFSFFAGTRLRNTLSFDATCVPHSPPIFTFSLTMLASLFRYIYLAYLVYNRNNGYELLGVPEPVSRLFRQESLLTTLGSIGILLGVLPYGAFARATAHALFIWPTTFTSILCCHLILSMRESAIKRRTQPKTPPTSESDEEDSEVS